MAATVMDPRIRRQMGNDGEGSVSKTAKALSAASTSSLVSSVIVKQEPEGEVAHGGTASLRARGVIAQQANPPPIELPRNNVILPPQLLRCAAAGCFRPLKPPVFKCVAGGHRLCNNCSGDGRAGHCRVCSCGTTFVHCGQDVDDYIGGVRVACPFQVYGCDSAAVAYHDGDAHRDACAYAPCHCAQCHFVASPPALRDHLVGVHGWRLHAVPGYGELFYLRAAVSDPPHRLLVVDGDERRLFVLSVRARAPDVRAVSLACVRASAVAWPRYSYTLWWDMPANMGGRWLGMETDVPCCAVPGAAAAGDEMALCVLPAMLVGPQKEIHLKLRIYVAEPSSI